MEKGKNFNTEFVLKMIGKEKIDEIDFYIENILKENCVNFKNKEEIEISLNTNLNRFIENLNTEEKNTIREYTGLNFRKINSILRGYWDYEITGRLTENMKFQIKELSNNLRKILIKSPELPFNMVTYRGVNISAFRSFGITTLQELPLLKNNFIYEEGFTSTSMVKETSFYEKQPEWGNSCNIEITYVIPTGADDGIMLTDEQISYSPNQNEYLINNSSLFKVLDVEVNEPKNCAKIKMILIPQKIWNLIDYEIERKDCQEKRI